MPHYEYDAIVIGSGPNGFGTAITLAQAGLDVCMFEAKSTVGGGMRTLELTEPGYLHDVCSAIHPLGLSSPFFRKLPLDQHGLKWIQPEFPLAHPLDDGTAVIVQRSIEATADELGVDGTAYRRLMASMVRDWDHVEDTFLGPLRIPSSPRTLLALPTFGLPALLPARTLTRLLFREERAAGMFAGLAAHSLLPMERLISASFGLVLGLLAHKVGWPLPEGGSQSIADALASYFESLGGKIILDTPVTDLKTLPRARAYLFDTGPDQLSKIAGDFLPDRYLKQLNRLRYAPGVFKVDYAVSDPIPWRDERCKNAGTVHLGSTMAEIAASERAIWQGKHAEKPYVLLAQQSLFDPTRAPDGKHTVWAYCHVPHGSTVDMTARIEDQIERYAPGFRDTIIAKKTMNTTDYHAYNPNYIGGDINGGVQDIFQLFTRPTLNLRPYRTPSPGIYLCSSSTPPGGGVHGMCGYHAARTALYDMGIRS